MKRWSGSAWAVRSTVLGVVACGAALVFSCSPAGSDSKVTGGDGSAAAPGQGGTSGGVIPGGSGSQAGAVMIGGDIPTETPEGPCTGLGCQVPACTGAPTTSISGKVYDPAGKVPLYNVGQCRLAQEVRHRDPLL